MSVRQAHILDRMPTEILRNEIFLEVIERPFRKNCFLSLLRKNETNIVGESIVPAIIQAIAKRETLNKKYSAKGSPERYISSVVNAASVFKLDVLAARFEQTKSAEDLNKILDNLKHFKKISLRMQRDNLA